MFDMTSVYYEVSIWLSDLTQFVARLPPDYEKNAVTAVDSRSALRFIILLSQTPKITHSLARFLREGVCLESKAIKNEEEERRRNRNGCEEERKRERKMYFCLRVCSVRKLSKDRRE